MVGGTIPEVFKSCCSRLLRCLLETRRAMYSHNISIAKEVWNPLYKLLTDV